MIRTLLNIKGTINMKVQMKTEVRRVKGVEAAGRTDGQIMSAEIDENMIAALDTVGHVIIKYVTVKMIDQVEETDILIDGQRPNIR